MFLASCVSTLTLFVTTGATNLAPSRAARALPSVTQILPSVTHLSAAKVPLLVRRGFFRRSLLYSRPYYRPYYHRDLTWADAFIFGFVLLVGSVGRNLRAERVVEGQRTVNPNLLPKVWNDQNGADFFTNGHHSNGRFIYCLESTEGRHGKAITERLRALDDEVTRMGLTFHKVVLVSPKPEIDTVQRRKSWMVRNKLDEKQWSFVTSSRNEIDRLISAYHLTPSAKGDVRVSLIDGRGFVLLSRPLHELPLQQLANEIIKASHQAYAAAQADRERPVAKGTGTDGLPDPLGVDIKDEDDI